MNKESRIENQLDSIIDGTTYRERPRSRIEQQIQEIIDKGIGGGGGSSITVDSVLSTTSENPVQNKVITAKINEIEGNILPEVTIDTELSETSENPVQNKVITAKIKEVEESIPEDITVDNALSETSENPVQNKVITTELASKAPTNSPTFTGTPEAPTADIQSNTDQLATTAFVKAVVNALVNGAPETLDTLKELADAIQNNEDVIDALNAAIGDKADKDNVVNKITGGLKTPVGNKIYYNGDVDLTPNEIAAGIVGWVQNIIKESDGTLAKILATSERDSLRLFISDINNDIEKIIGFLNEKASKTDIPDTSNFLSTKKGGTVNNTFIVNKVSSTTPTNLKEIMVESDGKVAFLGTVSGVNNALMHLDATIPSAKTITMKNANYLILPNNVEGPPSVTLNIDGAGGGVHLEHKSHSSNPNAGLWVTETGVVINSADGLMDTSERNHNFTAASFNQSNHRIRLYTPDINIGPDGDFFIQAYFGNDSVSNSMYKNIKIRGALDSSITMEGVNDPKTIFGQRNGNFVFRNFDFAGRNADITNTLGYSDTIATINKDGTLMLFTDYDNEDTSYDVKLSGYDGLIFGDYTKSYIAYRGHEIVFNNYINNVTRLAKINMYIQNGNTFQFFASGTSLVETKNLGNSSYKWTNIYATNGTIQTSDRNEKNTIHDLTIEEAEALIYGASPKTYRMNSGTSNRIHWGLISQDVEEQLKELGWSSLDFAGFIKSPKEIIITEDENGKPLREPITQTIEGEYTYSLRYDEYVAPLIKIEQSHNDRLTILETTITKQAQIITDLEARISKLEALLSNS